MKRSFTFKFFIHVLILSLLNLQFSSLAYGMNAGTAQDDGGPAALPQRQPVRHLIPPPLRERVARE